MAEACTDAVSAVNVHLWCMNRMSSTYSFMSDPDTMIVTGPGSRYCTMTAPAHGAMLCDEGASTRGELLHMAKQHVLGIM